MIFPKVSLVEDSLLPIFLWGSNYMIHQHSVHRNSGFGIRGQLCLCNEGNGVFIDSNCISHEVQRGDIMYMLPKASHSYFPKTNPWFVKYLVIGGTDLENMFFRAGLLTSGIFHVPDKDFDEVNELFDKLIELTRSTDIDIFAKSSVLLYTLILKVFKSNKIYDEKDMIKKHSKLLPVINYIEQNYYLPISLQDLADVIGVTTPYLCDIFKKTYKVSPQIYINNKRIENAKRQLCQRNSMTVKEIAEQNGFNDSAYFCNVFKKLTGITPNDFRIANTYRTGKKWEEFN